jgi:sensor histidine kinase YesM
MQLRVLSHTVVRPLWQVGSVLALGIGMHLLTDLIFGLRYRNYRISWHWGRFGSDLILAFLILGGIRFIKRQLNQKLPWERQVRKRFFWQFVCQTFWIFLVASVVRNGIFRSLLHPSPDFVNLNDELLLTLAMVCISLLVVSIELAIFLLNKWRMSLAQLERFKKENIEFHLEMLKTQVNPHFLFNNLNALSSLIYTNQDTAAEFVRQLAKVYRYVLENRAKEIISLDEELTFLEAYIYLVDLRFGHNLRIHVNLPDPTQRFAIAPLTLQMLIENAIKHNIVSQKKPLDVFILQENGYLVVQNLLQLKPVKEFSSKIGLKNIVSRYRFITDKPVEIVEDGRTFTVRIPLVENLHSLTEHNRSATQTAP